jgi:large subunit ribosomal protein L18
MALTNRKTNRIQVHKRIRKKLRGTTARPRLAVFFSNKNVYAQLIDDDQGLTLCSASTKEKDFGAAGSNVASAVKVGELVAERAIAKNVNSIVFDRGGFNYHGKVKALADAAREKGLQF